MTTTTTTTTTRTPTTPAHGVKCIVTRFENIFVVEQFLRIRVLLTTSTAAARTSLTPAAFLLPLGEQVVSVADWWIGDGMNNLANVHKTISLRP